MQQIKGPKARLAAALKPDVNLKRIPRDPRALSGLVWLGLTAGALAWLLLTYPPNWPSGGGWTMWIDHAAFVAIGLSAATAIGLAGIRTLNAWKASAPASPEGTLREFYRCVRARSPRPRRLARLLCSIGADLPASRPVMNWMTASAFPRLDSARAVAKYWRALLRGNPLLVRSVTPLRLDVEHPVADVALAKVKLSARVTRRPQALAALTVGTLIAAIPLMGGPGWTEAIGLPFWTAAAACVAAGAGAWWLIRRFSKAVIQQCEVTVYKLLVRNANSWRMLSGEWEGADEVDATWLLGR